MTHPHIPVRHARQLCARRPLANRRRVDPFGVSAAETALLATALFLLACAVVFLANGFPTIGTP